MKAKVRVVWLSRAFDGIGAFSEGITEREGFGFDVRHGGRLLGVPWSNVAGVEYSAVEEATVTPTPPVVSVASPPVAKGRK